MDADDRFLLFVVILIVLFFGFTVHSCCDSQVKFRKMQLIEKAIEKGVQLNLKDLE